VDFSVSLDDQGVGVHGGFPVGIFVGVIRKEQIVINVDNSRLTFFNGEPVKISLGLGLGFSFKINTEFSDFSVGIGQNLLNTDRGSILKTDELARGETKEVLVVFKSDIASVNVDFLSESDVVTSLGGVSGEVESSADLGEFIIDVFNDDFNGIQQSENSASLVVQVFSYTMFQKLNGEEVLVTSTSNADQIAQIINRFRSITMKGD